MIIKCVEKVDKEVLKAILENPNAYDLGSLYIDGHSQVNGVATLLRNYYKLLNENGEIEVSYKQKKRSGRHWPSTVCLTTMCRKVRHSIGRDYHIDVDIVNCHPILLEKLCLRMNVDCPNLKEYNDNRHLYKDHKERVIQVMYGSNVSKNDDDIVISISNEMRDIYPCLAKEFPLFEKIAKKKPNNVNGSMAANIMQNEENKCLEIFINTLESNFNIRPMTLAYDGFTIEKTRDNIDQLDIILPSLEQAVKRELGYDIQLKIKPMDKYYPDVLNNNNKSPLNLIKPLSTSCGCLINHCHMSRAIEYMVNHHNISSFNFTFDKVAKIIVSSTAGTCHEIFMNILTNKIVDYDEKELIEYVNSIERLDEVEGLKLLLAYIPNKKPHKDIRNHFERIIKENKKSLKRKDVEDSFSNEDEMFDFIQYMRTTTFKSKESLKQYFIDNVGKYVKFIQSPEVFVVNEFTNNLEDTTIHDKVLVKSIAGTCSYQKETINGDVIQYMPLFKGPNSLYADLEIQSKVNLYRKISFNPAGCNEKDLNMYSGFVSKYIEDPDEELIAPILNHIRTCWANDDDNIYGYILQWLRACFKHPEKKTQIVLLIYGEEGTGKGFLVDNLLIPWIYGNRIACVSHGLTPITQRFNTICMNKLFICCNEVSSEGHFHSAFEKLKAIITDPTMPIEKKGIDMFEDYANYINFIFTTNNLDSVKLGKSDRRYCCLETSSRYRGDFDYFTGLADACNQETANHFYSYIINLERDRNIKEIPATRLKTEMSIHNTTSCDAFLKELKDYMINNNFDNNTPDTIKRLFVTQYTDWRRVVEDFTYSNKSMKKKELFYAYNLWCCETNEKKKKMREFFRAAERKGFEYKPFRIAGQAFRAIDFSE